MTPRTLPIRVAPVDGEAIDSWLEAYAHRYRIPLGHVLAAFNIGFTGRPYWIINLPEPLQNNVALATGINSPAIAGMTLSRYNRVAVDVDQARSTLTNAFPWTYSSARGVTLEEIQYGEHKHDQSIIWMDPPAHRRMRSLVNKVFTPRAIQKQEDVVHERVNHHLSTVDPNRFDVVAEFSALFPVEVITTMLGVPAEHQQQVRLWLDIALKRKPGQMRMARAGIEAMTQTGLMYYSLIQERRADPRDDMISALIAAEVDREDGARTSLDDVEITGFCTLLGGAGAETVAKWVGTAVVLFSRHPEQWQQLRADRSMIPAAVEEVLRYEGPVQYDCRYTTTDVRLHDTTIPAGSAVMLLGAAANRDERAFTHADSFDINRDRGEAQNLAFGYGIHSCLGAALARLESGIALGHLLDFMPEFDVDDDGLRRVAMTSVNGYENVPVRVRR